MPATHRKVVNGSANTRDRSFKSAWFDGLGRTIKSQSVDSSGDVFTETEYDNMGRVKKVSNPYRANETIYKTESFYDDLGRVVKIKTPDLAEVNTAYSLATVGNQIGTVVTVTDQAGKLRRSVTNALGQLTRVDEPDGNNQLGTVDAPNQPTNYSYDTLNNLTTVQQNGVNAQQCGGAPNCSQTRSFTYNSLSRLLSATNPESGTINYSYDLNGNLTNKTDRCARRSARLMPNGLSSFRKVVCAKTLYRALAGYRVELFARMTLREIELMVVGDG